jgi:hypothetical protein
VRQKPPLRIKPRLERHKPTRKTDVWGTRFVFPPTDRATRPLKIFLRTQAVQPAKVTAAFAYLPVPARLAIAKT